uniref:Serpin domain-containing protein n=1 Tax=Periophthalmus magnuspinnatus TaxID=409849 RepID=A0A3B4BGL3_9GOBI
MKSVSLLWLCAAVALFGLDTVLSQAPSYGERGSDLGIQVFQQVARSKPLDNVVLSPHGVASILGMLLSGTHGDTRKQIVNALRYKKNGPYKMLRKLHKTLTAKSNLDAVVIANAIFTQEGFPLEEEFMETNRLNFQTLTSSLDFTNPQGAADHINEWVNNNTQGHIPTLIKADMLDSALTRLIVVNSIFFKGLWKTRFQPENTKMRPFHGGNGNLYKVPMMSQLSVFNMAAASTPQGLKYKVIELPYHGALVSMLIILPSEEDTPLSQVLPHISTATVQSWDKLMHTRKFRLLIPRYGITHNEVQTKTSSEPLFVSKALQKAKVIVNEDGTKASAATMAILLARSSPPWVTVDRPFLFLIRHNPTGTILFMGQINQP